MSGFKNSTKMVQGHHFAAGGHVGHFAHPMPVSPKPANGDTVNGLTARAPDMEGHAAVHRGVPTTDLEEKHGGTSPLLPGYKQGGQTGKAFHVHNHYHGGKKMPGKKARASAEKKAMGGLIGPKAKATTTKTSAKHETKNPRKKGGMATGGTINCMNAGGALYGKGGKAR